MARSRHHPLREEAGDLQPICIAIAAAIGTAARATPACLPDAPRLRKLAREVRARAGLAPCADFAAIRLVRGIVP